MSGLETNLKSTRPRPGHYKTKTETVNINRSRDRDQSRDLHHWSKLATILQIILGTQYTKMNKNVIIKSNIYHIKITQLSYYFYFNEKYMLAEPVKFSQC